MKILVTGGMGFIGRHLVKKLKKDGHNVFVFDLVQRPTSSNKFGAHDLLSIGHEDCSWLDFGGIEPYDVVIHLAAYVSASQSIKEPEECYAQNMTALQNVLYHFKFKRIVFASSAAVYGSGISQAMDLHRRACEINTPRINELETPYAKSKLMGEEIIKDVCPSYANLRFFNVYGKMQNPAYGAVVQAFGDAYLRKENFQIYGDGSKVRDFVHVDDVVSAIIFSMNLEENITANVGTGIGTSILELCGYFGGQSENIQFNESREGDPEHSIADVRVLKELGWEAQHRPEEGMAKYILSVLPLREFLK